MTTAVENHKNHGIRWDVVVVISSISIVGILGPKLLWMNSGYASMVRSWPIDAQYMIHPVMRMLLVLVGWLLIMRMRQPGQNAKMGLAVGWLDMIKGLAIGFGCTFPMLLLGFMSTSYTPSHYEILYTAISPGITEEVFYRAFLFGLLVQVARCPIWTTAVLTGIVFGLAHVDITPSEGQTIVGQLGPWIAMIALGGFMYAWLYWESRYNLWVVIALHTGMNMWWDMFDLTQTPLGGWGATIARIASVGLVVLFVVGLRVFGKHPGATISHEHIVIDT